MTDIVRLGVQIDTSSAIKAKADLAAIVPAAQSASTAMKQLQAAATVAATGLNAAAVAEEEVAAASSDVANAARVAAVAEQQAAVASQNLASSGQAAAVAATNVASAQNVVTATTRAATNAAHGHANALGIGTTQMMSLMHAGRGMSEMLAQGVPISRIFAMEINNISYALMGPDGLISAMGRVGVGNMFGKIASGVTSLATRFLPFTLAVAVAAGVLAGLDHELNVEGDHLLKAGRDHISFGTTVKAVFQTVWDGVKNLLGPAAAAISPMFAKAWQKVEEGTAAVVNFIAGGFKLAIDEIQFAWQHFPDLIGYIITNAANNTIRGIQSMVNGAIGLLNGLIDRIDKIPGINLAHLSDVSFGQMANPYADALQKAAKESRIQQKLYADANYNYAGALKRNILNHAVADENAPTTEELKQAAAAAAQLQKQFTGSITGIDKETASLQAQIAMFGQSAGAVAAYTKEQEVLTWAQDNNLKLSPKQLAALHAAAQAYGQATDALERLKAMQDFTSTSGQDLFDQMWSVATQTESLGDAFKSLALDIAKAVAQAELLGTGPLATLLGTSSSSGGVLGSIFSSILGVFGIGASVNHTGYGPGDPITVGRYVHPAYFDDAPRYHTGIGPGERAAIIRDDESVLTPGQMKAIGRGMNGGSNAPAPVSVYINKLPAEMSANVHQSAGRNGGQRIDVDLAIERQIDGTVARLIEDGQSKTSRAFGRNYGASRRL
jgi:hypothetical protein